MFFLYLLLYLAVGFLVSLGVAFFTKGDRDDERNFHIGISLIAWPCVIIAGIYVFGVFLICEIIPNAIKSVVDK